MSKVHVCLWVVGLFGCHGSTGARLEDCAGLSGESDRNECYARFLPERFRTEPDQATKMVENEITEQRIRDFVYLTVTRTVDPGTYRWCQLIQEDALQQRCRVLVSRPHLHRELVGTQGPPSNRPGRGAPPGAALPGSPRAEDQQGAVDIPSTAP